MPYTRLYSQISHVRCFYWHETPPPCAARVQLQPNLSYLFGPDYGMSSTSVIVRGSHRAHLPPGAPGNPPANQHRLRDAT